MVKSIVNYLNERNIGYSKNFNKLIYNTHNFYMCEKVMVYGVWCKTNSYTCRFCGKYKVNSVKQLLKTKTIF